MVVSLFSGRIFVGDGDDKKILSKGSFLDKHVEAFHADVLRAWEAAISEFVSFKNLIQRFQIVEGFLGIRSH